jgi:hypothetical protein
MLGRFFGGWKNSSCDRLDVENCLLAVMAMGRMEPRRQPAVVVVARPLRLAVRAGVNNVLVFIVDIDE